MLVVFVIVVVENYLSLCLGCLVLLFGLFDCKVVVKV